MYNIPIKVEGVERRRRSIGLLHILAGFFLLLNAGEYSQRQNYDSLLPFLPVFITALASIGYGFFRKKIDPVARYNRWFRLSQITMFVVLAWISMNPAADFRTYTLLLWAAICGLLLFSEKKAFHNAALQFTTTEINLPGYFANKIVDWAEVEDIVIRQDFVTLYYPNNKYTQYEVLNDIAQPEIEQINAFCKEQVHLSKIKNRPTAQLH